MKHNSKYWLYRNILNIAKLYHNMVIYFPTFLDFRGRVYAVTNYFNYQGGDIARSLLLFSNAKSEEIKDLDMDYLYIYMSDTFGGNRSSRSSRIRWVKNNLDDMFYLYKNDKQKFREKYLSKAKEKAQFMACFLALYSNDIYYICRLPILFDATCSGMQHLSALTTNVDLASMVNIIAGENPSDFYDYCAKAVRECVSNLDDVNLRNKLSNIIIDRSMVKIPVMTIPYNVGLKTMSKRLLEKYEKGYEDVGDVNAVFGGIVGNIWKSEGDHTLAECQARYVKGEEKTKLKRKVMDKRLIFKVPANKTLSGEGVVLTGYEAGKLASIVYRVVNSMMPSINPLRSYLRNMINVLAKLRKPVF